MASNPGSSSDEDVDDEEHVSEFTASRRLDQARHQNEDEEEDMKDSSDVDDNQSTRRKKNLSIFRPSRSLRSSLDTEMNELTSRRVLGSISAMAVAAFMEEASSAKHEDSIHDTTQNTGKRKKMKLDEAAPFEDCLMNHCDKSDGDTLAKDVEDIKIQSNGKIPEDEWSFNKDIIDGFDNNNKVPKKEVSEKCNEVSNDERESKAEVGETSEMEVSKNGGGSDFIKSSCNNLVNDDCRKSVSPAARDEPEHQLRKREDSTKLESMDTCAASSAASDCWSSRSSSPSATVASEPCPTAGSSSTAAAVLPATTTTTDEWPTSIMDISDDSNSAPTTTTTPTTTINSRLPPTTVVSTISTTTKNNNSSCQFAGKSFTILNRSSSNNHVLPLSLYNNTCKLSNINNSISSNSSHNNCKNNHLRDNRFKSSQSPEICSYKSNKDHQQSHQHPSTNTELPTLHYTLKSNSLSSCNPKVSLVSASNCSVTPGLQRPTPSLYTSPAPSRASSQDATVAKPSKEDIALVSAHNYAPALECCLLNTIANVCFHLMFFVSYPVVFSVCL